MIYPLVREFRWDLLVSILITVSSFLRYFTFLSFSLFTFSISFIKDCLCAEPDNSVPTQCVDNGDYQCVKQAQEYVSCWTMHDCSQYGTWLNLYIYKNMYINYCIKILKITPRNVIIAIKHMLP